MNPATQIASVRYDADRASTRALVDAIEDAGFRARDLDHWKRYIVETDPAEIARHLTIATFAELAQSHEDALHHIAATGHDRIGVFAEGLGGYVAFYLALAHGPMHSLVCQ